MEVWIKTSNDSKVSNWGSIILSQEMDQTSESLATHTKISMFKHAVSDGCLNS